jgi:hypothetical protein
MARLKDKENHREHEGREKEQHHRHHGRGCEHVHVRKKDKR